MVLTSCRHGQNRRERGASSTWAGHFRTRTKRHCAALADVRPVGSTPTRYYQLRNALFGGQGKRGCGALIGVSTRNHSVRSVMRRTIRLAVVGGIAVAATALSAGQAQALVGRAFGARICA